MKTIRLSTVVLLSLLIGACTRQAHTAPYINFSNVGVEGEVEATSDPYIPPTRVPNQPVITPTPSPQKPLPTLRTEDVYYSVQWGDTIKSIAYLYDVLPELIIEINQIPNSGLIYAGQQLLLPAPDVT